MPTTAEDDRVWQSCSSCCSTDRQRKGCGSSSVQNGIAHNVSRHVRNETILNGLGRPRRMSANDVLSCRPVARKVQAARIASQHYLRLCDPTALYAQSEQGDAWACNVCDHSFLIAAKTGHKWVAAAPLRSCWLRSYQECNSCYTCSASPRAPCIASTETQTVRVPPSNPVPVALWPGM